MKTILKIMVFEVVLIAMAQNGMAGSPADKGEMISREEAKAVIINEIIEPGTLKHDVLAFLVLEPLKKGDRIAPHGFTEETVTLQEPTWFAWIDDEPDGEFAHPCRYVFLNARTGKYIVKAYKWGPVLNDTEVLWRELKDRDFKTYLIFSTYEQYNME